MTASIFRRLLYFMIIAGILLSVIPASARDFLKQSSRVETDETNYHPVQRPYEPIRKIDLGVKELTLEVGETYTFRISYEPEEPYYYTLKWHVTDNTVISTDQGTNTVTALAPGSARILAESLDGMAYTTCDVTVNGPAGKDAAVMKAGSELVTISASDRAKISAKSVKRYLDFVESSTFGAASYQSAAERVFTVTADVIPGTEEAQSRRALALGMAKAQPLKKLNMVNLRGTLEQILAFTSDNPDLIKIFELENSYLTDPTEPEEEMTGKAVTLEGYTEELTSISTAHNLGLKGDGYAIAILDTGLNVYHEQFTDRIAAQHCFSTTTGTTAGTDRYVSSCLNEGSAEPNSYVPKLFNHGSHVAGIAAGRDGIAPNAELVPVQIFSDLIWNCTQNDIDNGYFWKKENSKDMCIDSSSQFDDQLAAYDWILETQDAFIASGKAPIIAVNMSYGSSATYSSSCDSSYPEIKAVFDKFIQMGMIPVAASGNNSSNSNVGKPGCISNVFTVGSLSNSLPARIRNSSNHNSEIVDMLAPGSNIYSAFYAYEANKSDNACSTGGNCYGRYSGTSMAAPMVSGAFAILKQSNPDLTAAQLKNRLIAMSSYSVNQRLSGHKFSYSKPGLDFSKYSKATSLLIANGLGQNITDKNYTVTTKNASLRAAISPTYTMKTVNWTSSNTSVATVSSKGLVTFITNGTVKITATTKDGSRLTAVTYVTYGTPKTTAVNIYDNGTNVTGKTIEISNFAYQLQAKASPTSAFQEFQWTSSSTAIAAVSSSGKVTFNTFGTVTITAKAIDGSNKSAWVKLVYAPKATSVKILNSAGTDVSGKAMSVKADVYQLKAAALPANVSQTFTWSSSHTAIAVVDTNGKVTFKKAGTVIITAKTTDGSNISAWVKLTYAPKAPVLEIKDSNIRGKNKEIQITIPWSAELTEVECTLYNDGTGQEVSMTMKERMDSTGKNRIISYVGNPLVNGTVYRFKVRVFNGAWSNYVEKYAMPIANVYGATVVAGNQTMVINNQWRENTTGSRYMLCDADTEKEIAYRVGTKTNTTWTYNELTNGKLYYVIAVPYRDYKGQRLWGPNQMRIYFIPMSFPSGGTVTFTSGTTARISVAADSTADGIRVLYRTVGGALKNGCEGSGSQCNISGLNQNTAYEFYALKYKTAQGKKYYSMGAALPYKSTASGVTAPQNNPVVTMTNSGYTTFSIKKSSNAEGISVLYREGEGSFQQACEKAGNTCSLTLSTTKNYTFYIMQYRTLNGKKVYSNGIIARDFSSGKTIDVLRLYTNFTPAGESVSREEIYKAMGGFLTEDDLLMAEALKVIAEDPSAKAAEPLDFTDDDDSWIEEYALFENASETKTWEQNSMPEPEEEPFSWFNFYRIDDRSSDKERPVPSFENK